MTCDGAKSRSSKMSLLKGTIPAHENPAMIFFGVTANGKDWRTIPGMSYMVIV